MCLWSKILFWACMFFENFHKWVAAHYEQIVGQIIKTGSHTTVPRTSMLLNVRNSTRRKYKRKVLRLYGEKTHKLNELIRRNLLEHNRSHLVILFIQACWDPCKIKLPWVKSLPHKSSCQWEMDNMQSKKWDLKKKTVSEMRSQEKTVSDFKIKSLRSSWKTQKQDTVLLLKQMYREGGKVKIKRLQFDFSETRYNLSRKYLIS